MLSSGPAQDNKSCNFEMINYANKRRRRRLGVKKTNRGLPKVSDKDPENLLSRKCDEDLNFRVYKSETEVRSCYNPVS